MGKEDTYCNELVCPLRKMKITWRTRERATEETEGLKLSGSVTVSQEAE